MNRVLASGTLTGLCIGAVLWLLWALTIAITDKEPAEVREAYRVKPPQAPSTTGMSFDLRTCSHCPDFLLFDRGYRTGGIFAPLVAASLPAVLLSRDYSRYWIPELRPAFFGSLLLVEGLVVGLASTALRAKRTDVLSK